MINVIQINSSWLPTPDEDLTITASKLTNEYETEAGTTQMQVVRNAKLNIKGKWTLTGSLVEIFRSYRDADTVTVGVYYPNADQISTYTCVFNITSEKHISKARQQLGEVDGLYQIEVEITEL